MSDKFKKIDKEFLYTDSSVNSYGFRLLTSGYLRAEFEKNPIGYRMHLRDEGVCVKWVDFRVDGEKVYAKPVVNLSHPKGQQTVDEIENGFLNAASVGHIVALEFSNDPKDYLPDQKGVTVTKWFHRELSLVDIPGNYNALADLYDKDEKKIDLQNLNAQNFLPMNKLFFSPDQLLKMNLKADATQEDANTAFNDLVAKAAKTDQLTNDLAAANTAKKTAEDALTALKATVVTDQVKNLCDTALAEKKITKELSDKLAVDYKENPTGLKALLDAMPAHISIVDKLKSTETDVEALVKQGWDALDKAGKLEDLKAKNIDAFKALYKSEFKKEYAG